jgi:hypothetical protein
MQSISFFDKLPDELILNIIVFIDDEKTFASFVICCTRFAIIAKTYLPNIYWRSLYAKRWHLQERELKAHGKNM